MRTPSMSAPRQATDVARPREGALWAIVLAGGEGVRLRPLVHQICGDGRPKQYVPLLEARSLLQQTIDRLAPLIPSEHTVLVTMHCQLAYVAGALRDLRRPRVLAQPEDRGTAAAILLGAHWILARDPTATVLVVPSDHLILDEGRFMAHVAEVAEFVRQHPEWMTLLGAQPSEPETEYGWIEPGPPMAWTTDGPLRRVVRFWEKPSGDLASSLFANGCVWNTLVLVAAAATLVAAGKESVPTLNDRLGHLAAFFGTRHESWAMNQAYSLAPRANFSRSVLKRCPRALTVSPLPAVTWCDLGIPGRVIKTLRRLGLEPPWLSSVPHLE